jgi:hypothetical protein
MAEAGEASATIGSLVEKSSCLAKWWTRFAHRFREKRIQEPTRSSSGASRSRRRASAAAKPITEGGSWSARCAFSSSVRIDWADRDGLIGLRRSRHGRCGARSLRATHLQQPTPPEPAAIPICRLGGCRREEKCHGLCAAYLRRQQNGRPVEGPLQPRRTLWQGAICQTEGCERPVASTGLCRSCSGRERARQRRARQRRDDEYPG